MFNTPKDNLCDMSGCDKEEFIDISKLTDRQTTGEEVPKKIIIEPDFYETEIDNHKDFIQDFDYS